MATILVCDDDKDIVSAVKIYLESEGYQVLCAYNGEEAVTSVKEQFVDLVLMDIMMPVMDGIKAMVELRIFSNVPVILLTAKSEDMDKVLGLNVGADDYITKPFNPVELIARVKSTLRRYLSLGSQTKKAERLVAGGIEVDVASKEVSVDGTIVSLTPTEYAILVLFMENKNRVFSPKQIYQAVWDEHVDGTEGTVAVHIRHLREKIEINPAEPRYLQVVWGQGYILKDER